jgi:hypothetical protein
MITCKECKYWEEVGARCFCDKFLDKDQSVPEGKFLDVLLYDGGNFWTAPNFGCIHGVKK